MHSSPRGSPYRERAGQLPRLRWAWLLQLELLPPDPILPARVNVSGR